MLGCLGLMGLAPEDLVGGDEKSLPLENASDYTEYRSFSANRVLMSIGGQTS